MLTLKEAHVIVADLKEDYPAITSETEVKILDYLLSGKGSWRNARLMAKSSIYLQSIKDTDK